MNPLRILLLTNRDSDNVGDQIIEATVISIIKGVMKNLGFAADDFTISSRAAGIISKKYMKTKNPELLAAAREELSKADLLIFGGAPLFNYAYQNFYLRTITTLELAQEYGVPVLFSSIGVEKFDPNNKKSLALKKALGLPVVKQITTRDDIDSLRRYAEGTDVPVAHVADPAVLADIVYRKKPEKPAAPKPPPSIPLRAKRKLKRIVKRILSPGTETNSGPSKRTASSQNGATAAQSSSSGRTGPSVSSSSSTPTPVKKTIGLVVTRAGIFADNGIDFTEDDQRRFWLDTIAVLTERGYDYRLFTTGHFSDEVFLDTLIKEHGVPANKAAVAVNSPDELIRELRGCAGVIAYRLHASITSFALGIPSVGLSWNFKVPYFYESVGYGERALSHDHWTAAEVVPVLEKAMSEGVKKDEEFLTSVYDTLFSGIRDVFAPESTAKPFTLDELWDGMPRQLATGPKGYRDKVNRKLRRTYENYQKLSDKDQKLTEGKQNEPALEQKPTAAPVPQNEGEESGTVTEVLLLTNRDSDNIGDQIIEASVISLLKAAAKNLGIGTGSLKIRSRAASIISRKYMSTRDEALLEPARRAISRADVIVFGGAPLFNYKYQSFYLRTIRTLELAQEYGVPVLFSSIGVEPYSDSDSRSQQLREALNLPVVRQITTRDDLDSVKKYVAGSDIPTSLVADPAVFADTVFANVQGTVRRDPAFSGKRIGLVVTRAGIFADNGIDFPEAEQRKFWLSVIADLEARGDDYRLFTTGHFSDEIFLDSLVRHHGVPAKKAAVTLNSPEELVEQLRACDGVIAYRLHASITSFALGIPSIGLSWNFKVPDFYRSMGYPERALPASEWRSETVIESLDRAMDEGVTKDPDTLMSVYTTLFSGLKGIIAPDSSATAYSLVELRSNIPQYAGTTRRQYREKMSRKLRRSYGYYQERMSMDVSKLPQVGSGGSKRGRLNRRLKATRSGRDRK
ncbi:polysaccharide pyruvyl transferase family protein [Brevibacterium atlanticum]|uniref:polysaccharide pyruvyl transferase family protein n=1 Tax=Brevibacterium atlanticum TaxID=2697563 RepID=UPI00142167C7|nr:polysaccharide pyruvyl transferase family protein [Brevibacterium atlanticum]